MSKYNGHVLLSSPLGYGHLCPQNSEEKNHAAALSLLEMKTGVYWHFMKHTVIHHAKREYEEEDILIENLKDFEEFLLDLSQQDQRAFTAICKLAFQSRLNSN